MRDALRHRSAPRRRLKADRRASCPRGEWA
nr:DUF1534 domain-containing protein [Pseudomonas congelans]